MLPFLKPKQSSVAGLIIKNRSPDKPSENEELELTGTDHAQSLLDAIQAQDKSKIVECIRAIANSSESKEDKPSPHTYDAQNIKAAE